MVSWPETDMGTVATKWPNQALLAEWPLLSRCMRVWASWNFGLFGTIIDYLFYGFV